MKLLRLIVWIITLVSALLLPQSSFMMIERGTERPNDPELEKIKKDTKILHPDTRRVMDDWMRKQSIGKPGLTFEERLWQWTPTIEEWNAKWDDFVKKTEGYFGYGKSYGPLFAAASPEERTQLMLLMLKKLPQYHPDFDTTSEALLKFSDLLKKMATERTLTNIQPVSSVLDERFINLIESASFADKNSENHIKKLNDFYAKLPDNLKENERIQKALAKKLVDALKQNNQPQKNPAEQIQALNEAYTTIPDRLKSKELTTVLKDQTDRIFSELGKGDETNWFKLSTQILNSIDNLPLEIINHIYNRLRATIEVYFNHAQEFNWSRWIKSLIKKEQAKQPARPLTQNAREQIILNAYEIEFSCLNALLKVAQKLNKTSELIAVAKRLLRINSILSIKKALPKESITTSELEKIINDKSFIDATNRLKKLQNHTPILPEDELTALLEQFEATDDDTQMIQILWIIDQKYQLLADENDRKRVKAVLDNFFDELKKMIIKKTTSDGSLGDPNKERYDRVKALEQYNDFLKKSSIFTFNNKAIELQTLIDTCLKKTQEYDAKLKNQLNKSILDLSETLAKEDLATLLKEETTNRAKIDELLKRSRILDEFSYEKIAAQDFQRTLNAWIHVVDASKPLNQYLKGLNLATKDITSCGEAYAKLQQANLSIQKELDYAVYDPFGDSPRPRDFFSRTSMMKAQALILEKLSQLIKTERATNQKYALVALLSLPDNDKTRSLLQKQGFKDSAGNDTDLGLQLRKLFIFTASLDRRIKQLNFYVSKNKTEPQPLKTTAGVPIKLAFDLKLHLLIPDDQTGKLQETFKKIIPIWPTDRDSFLQYMQTNILTPENIRTILEISSIIATLKQGDLALLKQEFDNGVFAAIIDYTSEIARAPAEEREQRGRELYDVYRKFPDLVKTWGLNEEQTLVTLDPIKLDKENITYEKEYARSLETVAEGNQTALEKALLAERAKKSRFLTGIAIPAGLAVAEAVLQPPLWARITLGVILGIGGAIGGTILGALAGGAGAIPGAVGGAMAGYGLGDRIVVKIWELIHKGSGLEIADSLTGGRATPLVATAAGVYTGWKMWSAAQAIRPTDSEYELIRSRMIKIGTTPELRELETPFYQPAITIWHSIWDDEIAPKHRALKSQIDLIKQHEKNYNDSRRVYFDILNEALKLQGIQKLTPTSSYSYYVEVETKFNEEIKKLDKRTRELLRARVIKAKSLMLKMGIEWTGMQFEYARGEMNMISNIIYVQLLGQAVADPTSPEFLSTLKQKWDSKEFKGVREMWERNYSTIPDEKTRKESAQQDFSNWLNFFNQLFTVHDVFLKTLNDNHDSFITQFGKDGQRIYELYRDVFSGRFDSLMTSYRTTVDETLRVWGREPLQWGTAPIQQTRAVTAAP